MHAIALSIRTYLTASAMSWTLYVHTVKGKTNPFCVESSHSILSVKRAIQEQTGVQVHLQKLLFNGRHLEDNQATLLSYGVQNWAKIILVPQADPEAEGGCSDVVIKTLSGKSIVVQAKLSNTVEEVCSKIEKKEGMASEQQQLIYGGKVLDRDMTLDRYNIQHGSSLHVVCALAQRKVFFRMLASPGGRKVSVIPLAVLLSDSVENLSKKLAEKFGLPADRLELLFKGVHLEKEKSLSFYSVASGSTIDIQVKDDTHSQEATIPQDLFIRTPIGKVVSVKFIPSDTIRLIKEKVYTKMGLEPEKQVLLLAGNPLNDDATLSSYNISAESTFHLALRPESDDLVKIYVRTVTGMTFALDVNLSNFISDVKTKIHKLKGIPSSEQNLLVRGEPLSDSLTLRDYNIETESTFYLTLTAAPRAEDTLCLFIRTPEKTLELQVPRGSTVQAVKEEIFAAEKVSVEQQKLFLGSMELRDEGFLSSYGIQDNHLLNLQIVSPVPPQVIYIRNLLGKTVTVEVSSADKVKTLKERVFAKEGIPVEQLRLILHGMDLDDEESIGHYKIEQESSLQLALVVPEEMASPLRVSVGVPTATPGEWKNLTIEIPLGSKVRDLKTKLQEMAGIAPNKQVLFAGSQELLDDDATMDFYNIAMHDFLQLKVVRGRDKIIFVKNLKHTITLGVSLNDRVIDVKARIGEKGGIHPRRQRLLYQGRELEDNRVLSEYKIDQRSTLIMSVKEVPGCRKIGVKMPSGDMFPVDVYPGDTIASVKHAVQLVKHVATDRQILLSESGSILCDDADAIASGDILSLELRPVSVSVVASRYDRHCKVRVISVDSMTTVNDLQQLVEAVLSVPRNRLKFFHKGVVLTNEHSHLVEDNSVIMLGK